MEGDFRTPSWIGEPSFVVTGGNVTVTDDKGTTTTDDDVSATLRNFALVWSDGSVSGKIDNLSGSAAGIDVRVYQCLDSDSDDFCGRGAPIGYNAPIELTTNASGRFEFDGLTEGDYQVEIDDRGWSSPLLVDGDGEPDDDADATDSDQDDIPDNQAPSMADAYLEGRRASDGFATLYVYDGDASDNEELGASVVRGNMHGDGTATYNDTTGSVTTGLTYTAGDETTENLGSPLITIAYASETFAMRFARGALPLGASFEIENGTLDCSTSACEVGENRTVTGTDRDDGEHTDTITMTVTAANGYDDHEYSFTVARANPQDNMLESTAIEGGGSVGGAGTNTSPWTVATASATAGSVDLHINLEHWGTLANRNAKCAQTLAVKKGNGDDLRASADDQDDVCENERYRFAVAGSAYTLHVTSEDGVTATYYLVVNQGS